MSILNYTTKIDAVKSIGEITSILIRHGAKKITTDYDGEMPIAVTFCIELNGQLMGYSLPCNYAGVLKAMEKNKKVPRSQCTKDQAVKVCWRVLKDWIEAQCALIEAQVALLAQVFLPYVITKNGTTLFQHISENPQLLLEA